ncbi:Core trichothecene cluster (CTC) protein 15 [Fulvia fulva]|uniref:Core trichothecene cluster (CTC) protein 15 n=1 Tax=Passalora fulva TaxID=5499 RepID=A0A9Q8P8A7_PASFU|nr:Core trichothecene cluster (CTC) protein 15 [Fulvia fulva]KAK4615470.1 Core trichothecene cluster (CTC) protein 15 [Fulvia fulva]KAK4617247.1 Core trichothecene cluster (CTC) protein 15 [Fulvia fulva]UJO16933.1 Core trichothecene cluster (CTC) protein 15 [Fulvia fulva]WPV19759.1 Core trichothecene cluster (CTC) protein 15 [Fulvia fulva]WPV34528.1 Core trichothecene cluster (CTC) protein 15 [Fulvia fulva]
MVGTTVLCSTCNAHFNDNAIRRQHMGGDWHVYNMKRRIVELSPFSLEQYHSLVSEDHIKHEALETPETQLESAADNNLATPEYRGVDETETTNAAQCLFCLIMSNCLHDNLEHMATTHGFHIPRPDKLETDVETLLAYLQLVITQFTACLYCGHEKQSAEATRAHMLGKGHCMIDLSPESDFREFWEPIEGDTSTQQMLSETEMRTAAGTIVTSRQHQQSGLFERARSRTSQDVAIVQSTSQTAAQGERPEQSTSTSTSRSLALRDQMGIGGLSDTQRRGLAVVQNKMMAREQRSRNEARWVLEKFGNKTKQKHFKPDVPGRKNG